MIIQGNSYRIGLRDESVHCCVTSFPYYNLRSYGIPPTIWGGDSSCQHIWGDQLTKKTSDNYNNGFNERYGHSPGQRKQEKSSYGQIVQGQFCQLCGCWLGCFGLEPSISLHVANAVAVCREIKRVLRRDGVFFLNYGDSYATGKNGRSAADTKAVGKDDRTFRDKPFSVTELPAKNLCMIPARVAIALQEDGWILRSEFPWLKLNAMPSSVTDRPGTAHEHVFMLVKSARYYFDMEAVRRRQDTAGRSQFYDIDAPKGKTPTWGIDGSQSLRDKGRAPRLLNPAGRALRTSDPFFDSLDAYIAHLQDVRDNGGLLVDSEGLPAALVVNTESYAQAHYATFPRKLIAPLIKTTPEKVCPDCGKAWARVVEKSVSYESGSGKAGNKPNGKWAGSEQAESGSYDIRMGPVVSTKTTGWQPTCKCGLSESECIGAIICDPFAGSGTVGAVCRELGRRFIGIDLSATYLAENALPRSEKKMSLKALGQLPMFSEAASPRGTTPRVHEA